MYRYFININGYKKRYEQVKENEKGLYIEVGTNLFEKNDKYYLNAKETKQYNELLKHNERVKNRQEAIKEAKKEGRYYKTEQTIQNNNRTGIYRYVYYDREGTVI